MVNMRKFFLVALVFAIVAFLFGPMAPLGSLVWPPPVQLASAPTGAQEGLLMLLGIITSAAFGIAIAFLTFGWPAVRSVMYPRRGLAVGVFVSLVWVLGNWWLHDGLHLVTGLDPGGLVAIEYGFHVTLMMAGGTLVYAMIQMSRERLSQELRHRAEG
jgi:hypothetical protein